MDAMKDSSFSIAAFAYSTATPWAASNSTRVGDAPSWSMSMYASRFANRSGPLDGAALATLPADGEGRGASVVVEGFAEAARRRDRRRTRGRTCGEESGGAGQGGPLQEPSAREVGGGAARWSGHRSVHRA